MEENLPVYLNRGEQGVVLACHGHVTARQLAEAKKPLVANPAGVEACLFALVDHTPAEHTDYTIADVRALARWDHALSNHTRKGIAVAVVAPKDLQYGLARMWEALVEVTGWETMVFRSRSCAEAWIKSVVTANFGVQVTNFPDPNSAARVGRTSEPQ